MANDIDAASIQELQTDSPVLGESERGEFNDDAPQGILDFAADFLNIEPEKKAKTKAKKVPEESEEEEQELSDETEEESLEAEDEDIDEDDELSEDESDSIIDYDEAKKHKFQFKVGGKEREMTFDQIVSELGQAPAASKAQDKVKVEQREIAKVREELEADRAFFRRQQETAVESQQLGSKRARIEGAQRALNVARQRNDVGSIVKIKDDLDLMVQDYKQSEARVLQVQEETNSQLVNAQKGKLDELGYGNLLSDTQRLEAVSKYVDTNLSTSAAQAINYDASLLVAVEKARLWDSSQSKKGKLKTSKKTLKAGSGKLSASPKKEMTPDEKMYEFSLNLLSQGR